MGFLWFKRPSIKVWLEKCRVVQHSSFTTNLFLGICLLPGFWAVRTLSDGAGVVDGERGARRYLASVKRDVQAKPLLQRQGEFSFHGKVFSFDKMHLNMQEA